MAIVTKTITGKIVIPGTTIGIRAQVTATPMTTNSALKFPADNTIEWGPVSAFTDSAGIMAPLKIPVGGAPTGALWRFVATPLDKIPGLTSWTMGTFDITADADLSALVPIELTAFPAGANPTDVSVAGFIDSGTSATTASFKSRMAAIDADAASAFRVQQDARLVPKWKATTAYAAGDTVLAPDGSLVKAKVAFTSGTSYNATNWTSVAATTGTQEQTELAAAYAAKSTQTTVETGRLSDASLNANYATILTATAGDQTAAINTFLAAASPLGVKRLVGAFSISGTITLPGSDMYLDLSAAVITTSSATGTALAVTGDRAMVHRGRIVSPATWDGTNSTWTYAVVLVTGADCTVRALSLSNVPRVGIGFKDANGTSRALDCTIEGNYPAASWTEVETMHFGISLDPGVTSSKLIARGNTVRSCVQGIFLGNFGTGSSSGSIIAGNTFEGCHNHAVYGSASCTEINVTHNTITDCSRPIALTGAGHDVSHNTMVTTLGSGNLSEVCSINIRDAVDSTVSFNRMKGSVHDTVPAIDLARTGTNTVLTGNKVIGNKVEITGANTALAIRIGTGAETTQHGNIVSENHVKGQGLTGQGLISFYGATGSQGYSNKCLNNTVVITGATYGVYASEQRGLDVNGNTFRLEYDAASATTLGAVFLTNNSTGTKVRGNDIECTSSYGLNVTLRGIWEAATTVTAGRYGQNRFSFDLTKLAAGVTHVIQGTSGSLLDEALPGAPTTVCGPGSRWMRTDGGAATTLYVKESAAASAVWVAK